MKGRRKKAQTGVDLGEETYVGGYMVTHEIEKIFEKIQEM